MTSVAVRGPAAGHQRPVPWPRLAWVAWRQHRAALAGAAALLGVAALVMLGNGLAMRATSSSLGLNRCHPVTAGACAAQLSLFNDEFQRWQGYLLGGLQAVPVLAGVFTGGPLLARELETGTFRFAWTQGCGRLRLVVAKLVLPGLTVTAAAAAFSLVFAWWYRPLAAEGRSLLQPNTFDLSGVAFAGWTLAAFALGVLAGVVIRRVVPAMAAAIAVWAGLAVATPFYLRPHYQAPVVVPALPPDQNVLPPGAWTTSSWWTYPGGGRMPDSAVLRLVGRLQAAGLDVKSWVTSHHYGEGLAYQPAARFWHFQLIEGGWLLALALILGAAAVWMVCRRSA
jgi:hypothetical protein